MHVFISVCNPNIDLSLIEGGTTWPSKDIKVDSHGLNAATYVQGPFLKLM